MEIVREFGPPSFLQARDPSILAWNRFRGPKTRKNLMDEFDHKEMASTESEQDDCLKVFLRVKPCRNNDQAKLFEIEDNTLSCKLNAGTVRKYKFTHVFGPDTSQTTMFDCIIKHQVVSFLNGSNANILAYGISGSGKTFTMMGKPDNPGIIPRALDYIFRTVKSTTVHFMKPLPDGRAIQLSEQQIKHEEAQLNGILQSLRASAEIEFNQHNYNEIERRLSVNDVAVLDRRPSIISIWVSFAEIYNEKIYDLLKPLPKRDRAKEALKIGGIQDDVYIRDLKYVCVKSGLEAYQVLQYGLHNLKYAATAINKHSSRSHSVFSVRLVAGYNEKNCNISTINFYDLAGSERLKKTLNEGDRFTESTNINMSLSVLNRCIRNVRNKQRAGKETFGTFRESKLTHLCQKALQGKEHIMMIVNINPSIEMFDDTQHTLLFSAIAQQVVLQEPPPRKSIRRETVLIPIRDSPEADERYNELEELRDERANLVLELSELRERVNGLIREEREYLFGLHDQAMEAKDAQIHRLERKIVSLEEKVTILQKSNAQLRLKIRQSDKQESTSEEEGSDSEESGRERTDECIVISSSSSSRSSSSNSDDD